MSLGNPRYLSCKEKAQKRMHTHTHTHMHREDAELQRKAQILWQGAVINLAAFEFARCKKKKKENKIKQRHAGSLGFGMWHLLFACQRGQKEAGRQVASWDSGY